MSAHGRVHVSARQHLSCWSAALHVWATALYRTSADCWCMLQIDIPGSTPTTIQDYLAQNYGYHYSFIGPVVGILLGFTVFFAGLAIAVLMGLNYQKR